MSQPPTPPRPDLSFPPDRTRPTGDAKLRRVLMFLVALAVPTAILVQFLPSSPGDGARVTTGASDVCARTRELLDQAATATQPTSPPIDDLTQVLPSVTTVPSTPYPDNPWPTPALVAGGRPDADVWIGQLTRDGYQNGLWRQWQSDAGGVLQVEVLQFDSHAHAIDFQDWIIYASCSNADDVFAAPDVPGSIGLRLIWSNGDISEQVSFVRGSRRYLAAFRAGSIPPRSTVLSLTGDLAPVAR
jgi:hypothetical protein